MNRDHNQLAAGFHWLNVTQFLGAMNDNILKLLIVFCLISAQGTGQAGVITALVGAAFVLPFLLFSAPAGCLADRFGKSRAIVVVKVVEVAVTGLAVIAFALGISQGLYLLVFLMATHSAFFAPVKYGVIPELSDRDQLSRANGLIEAATFLAIIIGTATASVLAQVVDGRFWLASLFCLGVALLGLCSSLKIDKTRAAAPGRRVAFLPLEIARTIGQVRKDRDLLLAMIGY